MNISKLLSLLLFIILLTLLTGCYSVDNVIKDLESNHYTVETSTSEFDNIVHEYRVIDENGQFAAYILEFDNNEDAEAYFSLQDYESRMDDENLSQIFAVYKNLIIAFKDDNVFFIITGETYQSTLT